MVEIRLVGFQMSDLPELETLVGEALDAHGLKAAAWITFDNSPTRTLIFPQACPYVVVCSPDQKQLDTVALQMNATLGVLVKKELCQEFLLPLPVDSWVNRGR